MATAVEPLIWRPLPPVPQVEDSVEPEPYSGNSVLVRTPLGAVQGHATLRRVGSQQQVFWMLPPEWNVNLELMDCISHWCPAPENPYDNQENWQNPELVEGNRYLVRIWSKWVEGSCFQLEKEPKKWGWSIFGKTFEPTDSPSLRF